MAWASEWGAGDTQGARGRRTWAGGMKKNLLPVQTGLVTGARAGVGLCACASAQGPGTSGGGAQGEEGTRVQGRWRKREWGSTLTLCARGQVSGDGNGHRDRGHARDRGGIVGSGGMSEVVGDRDMDAAAGGMGCATAVGNR